MTTLSLFDAPSTGGAEFSPCGTYRYHLWRWWGPERSRAVFCMLNPSTADATQDDPTIRRCIRFAREWGHDGVAIVNLFALRSTDPRGLYDHADPIGEFNDGAIVDAVTSPSTRIAIAAWGVHGAHRYRGIAVHRMIEAAGVRVHCLGVTKDGHPRHPLYLRADTAPALYAGIGS